jgi:hypothetical protein
MGQRNKFSLILIFVLLLASIWVDLPIKEPIKLEISSEAMKHSWVSTFAAACVFCWKLTFRLILRSLQKKWKKPKRSSRIARMGWALAKWFFSSRVTGVLLANSPD